MARLTVRIIDERDNNEYWLCWSTVVDAPITYGLSCEDYLKWYHDEYGNSGLQRFLQEHEANLKYNRYEHSNIYDYNRAGDNEKSLNKFEIIDKYCKCEQKGE